MLVRWRGFGPDVAALGGVHRRAQAVARIGALTADLNAVPDKTAKIVNQMLTWSRITVSAQGRPEKSLAVEAPSNAGAVKSAEVADSRISVRRVAGLGSGLAEAPRGIDAVAQRDQQGGRLLGHHASVRDASARPPSPELSWDRICCPNHRRFSAVSMVPRGGIEPPTLRFSVACSTN
jgi:hypothetical protein